MTTPNVEVHVTLNTSARINLEVEIPLDPAPDPAEALPPVPEPRHAGQREKVIEV